MDKGTRKNRKTANNEEYDGNGNRECGYPNVKVALMKQRAEMIVKIECHFIHLICVNINWKHTLSTVGDLYTTYHHTISYANIE